MFSRRSARTSSRSRRELAHFHLRASSLSWPQAGLWGAQLGHQRRDPVGVGGCLHLPSVPALSAAVEARCQWNGRGSPLGSHGPLTGRQAVLPGDAARADVGGARLWVPGGTTGSASPPTVTSAFQHPNHPGGSHRTGLTLSRVRLPRYLIVEARAPSRFRPDHSGGLRSQPIGTRRQYLRDEC